MTKALKKSSKMKKTTFYKFLKKRNDNIGKEYQDYKKIFEPLVLFQFDT